jgi:hypothetical protein
MTRQERLIEVCYRQLTSNDFHVDATGITFSMSPEDQTLL